MAEATLSHVTDQTIIESKTFTSRILFAKLIIGLDS